MNSADVLIHRLFLSYKRERPPRLTTKRVATKGKYINLIHTKTRMIHLATIYYNTKCNRSLYINKWFT